MSEAQASPIQTLAFTAVRATHDSLLSFDRLFDSLQRRIGKAAHLGSVVLLPGSLEAYETVALQSLGESGFLTIMQIDFTHWLNKYGIRRRVFRWIVGNPLIAFDLMRHDPAAGLFMPFELLLTESEDGRTSRITYLLPSSLIVSDGNAALAAEAEALDARIAALIAAATAG